MEEIQQIVELAKDILDVIMEYKMLIIKLPAGKKQKGKKRRKS